MKPDIYKQLAATGKFHNTGKVLIGVAHQRYKNHVTADGEFIQGILLGKRRGLACPHVRGWIIYAVFLVVVFGSMMGVAGRAA